MKRRSLILLAIGMSCAAAAQKLDIGKTETMDFPAGGVLHLKHSVGEVTVEGGDQPGMEITITKPPAAYDRAEARRLEGTSVTAEHNGNELTITTGLRGRTLNNRGGFDYRIRVPRSASLIVEHAGGEVHVVDVAGDVRVTNTRGEITLRLPPDAAYAVDARSKFGGVVSDIPGQERRRFWLVGHRFVADVQEAAHKLYLRAGYGDIIIQKMRKPAAAQ
ncbi:MAG TPA: hypothetical protein VKT49_01485 [Bryobacteraceae bacterium]|nr:hypothetical protein [Bryobacteraceae bacterium]